MIDREKVIKKLESLRDVCNAKSNMAVGNGKVAWAGYANTADDAIALLKEQPELVRCKDCKYWSKEFDRNCLKRSGWFQTTPDWFCADGKRR